MRRIVYSGGLILGILFTAGCRKSTLEDHFDRKNIPGIYTGQIEYWMEDTAGKLTYDEHFPVSDIQTTIIAKEGMYSASFQSDFPLFLEDLLIEPGDTLYEFDIGTRLNIRVITSGQLHKTYPEGYFEGGAWRYNNYFEQRIDNDRMFVNFYLNSTHSDSVYYLEINGNRPLD